MTTTTVIEKPMLFSAPMVRALLDGRKTQTRRVVKPQPESDIQSAYPDASGNGFIFWSTPPSDKLAAFTKEQYQDEGIKPPHPVGNRIWVRETWATKDHLTHVKPRNLPVMSKIYYIATPEFGLVNVDKFRPSIHMPRWASRITLEITDVRVQRLQEITEEDARAEGVERYQNGMYRDYCGSGDMPVQFARTSFSTLWDSIHGPDAWEQNPWVWAYTFRRLEGEVKS